ncbi:HPr(Ser) kinase/phosphatase [Anoxynatronum sibiricum]|uniref:HPr kinase/phosphorylase n=1 Tax=Anoxynatronum sibiricum TaxID=210623 RepID=A0ABU9VPS6_9CLOT
MNTITVDQLMHDQQLVDLTPDVPGTALITTSDMNRPGIQLAGYFDFFAYERLQIIGKVEHHFLMTLDEITRSHRFDRILSHPLPCMLITRDLELPSVLVEIAVKHQVKLLGSPMNTTKLISRLINYLEFHLAETARVHGVLMDIYGVGVLITGKSGIGKSETAVELIKRNHLLVADDTVEIKRVGHELLLGYAPELTRHMIEVRGIGIMDVKSLFGVGAIKNRTEIDLVVHLEEWDQHKDYDRLGLDEKFRTILDVKVEEVVVPVKPARNIALIIEVAARNHRQKKMGYNAARAFNDRLMNYLDQDW